MLARRRSEPLPADPLVVAPPVGRRSWTTAVATVAVVLFAIGSAAIGSQLVVTPGPSSSAEPSASAEPSFAPSAQPSPTNPAEQIGPGTLAVVIEAAGVLDEPSGSQWALLEPDHHVLVVDVLHDGETEWYRVEFEFCCEAGAPNEWVFGWVAANLEVAGLASASFVPRDMESGYRFFPLHIPVGDPLLLAWLNDERVKQGEEVEIIGSFGPGAVGARRPDSAAVVRAAVQRRRDPRRWPRSECRGVARRSVVDPARRHSANLR